MAEAKKTEEPVESDAPKKKKKLLLMIIIAAVVVVLGGGGAAFFLMKKPADAGDGEELDEPPAKAAKAKKKKKEPGTPPAFVKLDPFVVKLQLGEQQQESYVQATPELKLIEATAADQIKQYTPEIRHKVLLILAGKKAADLSTPEGMQKLANQIRISINWTLTGEKPKAGVDADEDEAGPVVAVFLSSLIVQ